MKIRRPATKVLAASFAILFVLLTFISVSQYITGNNGNVAQAYRIACVGDSITEVTNYPEYLLTLVQLSAQSTNVSVGNFGVSGATVTFRTDRPYINQSACQQAEEFQPTDVIIMLGTNDARTNIYENIGTFVTDYKILINQFQGLESKPKIWIAIPPPLFDNNLSLSSAYLVNGVIPRIKQVAQELNLPTINLYTPLLNHPNYFPDGVHPNSQGARVIAMEINKAIFFGHLSP